MSRQDNLDSKIWTMNPVIFALQVDYFYTETVFNRIALANKNPFKIAHCLKLFIKCVYGLSIIKLLVFWLNKLLQSRQNQLVRVQSYQQNVLWRNFLFLENSNRFFMLCSYQKFMWIILRNLLHQVNSYQCYAVRAIWIFSCCQRRIRVN